jgi:hypothetical protein
MRLSDGAQMDEVTHLTDNLATDLSMLSWVSDDSRLVKKNIVRGWAVPFVLGNNYNIFWGNGNADLNWMNINIYPSVENFQENDPSMVLRFNYTEERELFDVEFYPYDTNQ